MGVLVSRQVSYNFSIFGKIEDEISFKAIKKIVKQFDYSNFEELAKIVSENDIDILLLLSIIPESFSYTLTESILLKLPLIATNLGAFPERLKNAANCELFDLDNDRRRTIDNLRQAAIRLAEKTKKQPAAETAQNMDQYNENIIERYLKLYNG